MSEFFLHSFNTLSHGLIGYIIPFLFVLTIVVFFHELGHFLIARWAGVKVLTFSLGFGPELVGFDDRHGTRWKISAVPLGGYVKFFGDESEASTPSSETLSSMTEEEREGSFHHKKVGPRAAIVAAGPIANFILAIVIFTCLFTFFGKPSTTARVDQIGMASQVEATIARVESRRREIALSVVELYARVAAEIKPGEKVLDVGCGPAGFARWVPQARYVGLEQSVEAQKVAADVRGHQAPLIDLELYAYLTRALHLAALVADESG